MDRLIQTLPSDSGTSKGDNGKVGVLGGSVDYPGQATLSALAALRTGSDVVRTLAPEPVYPIAASHSPNLLVSPYAGEQFTDAALDRTYELGDWADALVVGPGLADADSEALRRAVAGVDVPVVVDALAIEPLLDGELARTVFTPDSSERERIVDEFGSLETFTTETDAVVVATGDVDIIVADGERTENRTGTTALTVAGTGDTLAGIVASLIGQGVDRADAAELGAWVVGKAGELASADKGNGAVATDVIERIPDVIR